jgi:hypothetical protein
MHLVFLEHMAAKGWGTCRRDACCSYVVKIYSILVQRVAWIYVVGSTIVEL